MQETNILRNLLNGDLIRWDKESWILKSPLQTSVEETLDLERDICPKQLRSNALEQTDEKGFFMIPHRHTYSESVHVCKTLSGSLISYVTQNEFEDLTYFLSLSENMKAVNCVDTAEGSTKIKVWAGGTDEMKEGVWETWNTRKLVQVILFKYLNTFQQKSLSNSISPGQRAGLMTMVCGITAL